MTDSENLNPALSGGELAQLLGPATGGWSALGVTAHRTAAGDAIQIRNSDGTLIGLQPLDHAGRSTEQYKAIIGTHPSGEPVGIRMPGGFIPPNPQRAADAEYQRWGAVLRPAVAKAEG